MPSRRPVLSRAVSVLVLALAAVTVVAGVSPGATRFLTKKKALKLFYTKAKADAKFIDSDEASATVRTHDAHVDLPTAGATPATVVTAADLPPGKYLLTGKANAVNFNPASDYIRCKIRVGTTPVDASTATLGGSIPVGVLPLQGGFESSTPFTAILECQHDASVAGIYTESSRLVASRVGSLSVAAG
jgi:hypothetical protein